MDSSKVKVIVGDSSVCEIETGNKISGVVKALDSAKAETNTKLTSLVEEVGKSRSIVLGLG